MGRVMSLLPISSRTILCGRCLQVFYATRGATVFCLSPPLKSSPDLSLPTAMMLAPPHALSLPRASPNRYAQFWSLCRKQSCTCHTRLTLCNSTTVETGFCQDSCIRLVVSQWLEASKQYHMLRPRCPLQCICIFGIT